MYAIKPWGTIFLIGASVETYAMGIGMRWRESNVTIVEQCISPSYERTCHRRCVLTDQTVRLLEDLGCTGKRIRSVLRPALGWRFLNSKLSILRESCVFPGCAVGETAFHCAEGELLRVLRTEFMRFGGSLQWETEAYDAYENSDGTGTWCLRKQYGLGASAEAIIATSVRSPLTKQLIVDDPNRIGVTFDVLSGVSNIDNAEKGNIFGATSDVAIVLGAGFVIHMWLLNHSRCAWRIISKASWEAAALDEGTCDSSLLHLISSCNASEKRVCVVPATIPAIRDSASHVKVSILGDGLLPVDPFEWRGDNARCMVEEASSLCRALYGKKYHRGDVAFLLRAIEQDCISKRANLLQRDLADAENFLAVRPFLSSRDSVLPPASISSS